MKPFSREWTIETNQVVRFTIKSSPGIFAKDNPDLLEIGSTGAAARRLVAIDRNICQWYLIDVIEYFQARGIEAHVVAIDATEDNKNFAALLSLLSEMEQFGLIRRNEPLIAVGGGALLDIAGLAANLYRRGIPYIRVPTTLVGLVDASVGAKTGINFDHRRNRLGSYYPPVAAYLDKSFLATLPEIEISSGLGEILKMAVIRDYELFCLLEQHGQSLIDSGFRNDIADEVISRAVGGMKIELEGNLWEVDLLRRVDFGHSFSPIVEMRSIHDAGRVPLTHGQAVGLDVQFSSVLSHLRGMLSYDELMRIIATARNMSLPTGHELFCSPPVLLEALSDTVRHRNGAQNLPLPNGIGDASFINDLSYEEIKSGVDFTHSVNSQLGPPERTLVAHRLRG